MRVTSSTKRIREIQATIVIAIILDESSELLSFKRGKLAQNMVKKHSSVIMSLIRWTLNLCGRYFNNINNMAKLKKANIEILKAGKLFKITKVKPKNIFLIAIIPKYPLYKIWVFLNSSNKIPNFYSTFAICFPSYAILSFSCWEISRSGEEDSLFTSFSASSHYFI